MEARLDSGFESWGHFGGGMTDSQEVPGRLSYDPANGISLELVRSPTGTDLRAAMDLHCPPTLYGRLVNGTRVTLVDYRTTHAQFGAGGAGLPTIVIADRMLVGDHVENLDHLPVKSYTVEFSSLFNWTCAAPAKLDMPVREGKCLGVDVSFRRPSPIEIALHDQEFDLKVSHGWTTSDPSDSFALRWHTGVTIVAHFSLALFDAFQVALQCRNLMSLLIGDRISVKSIAVKPVDQTSASKVPSPLHLVYNQHGRHDYPDLHASQMLLPYSQIATDFPRLVSEWFSRSEQAVLATNVFFGSQLFETTAVDLRLLTITQVAESYHRSLGTGVYMKQDEYDTELAKLLAHMPAAIQGDHRRSLENRLRYGNEHSLRRRLTEMLRRLPANAQTRIAGDVGKFVNKIVDTRNYFTHYDHDARGSAFKGRDVFIACERLRILVLANLLRDLGVSGDSLLRTLERNPDFQHWMSQDLPC